MPVLVERRGPVTTVVLSRPQVANAVDRETALALADAFRAFDADDDAHAAVLCADGPNFCAGADLKRVAAGEPNRVQPVGDAPMGPSRMLLSKPVVAAICGHAVAGGLELALWCDLRVADEDAVLGVFCRRWGVPLIDGGTVRLPRLIGLGRALDLILTGRAVGAREALEFGLVNRVARAGGRPRSSRWSSPAFRRPACATTACRPTRASSCRSPARWRTSSSMAWSRCAPTPPRGRSASPRARVATARRAVVRALALGAAVLAAADSGDAARRHAANATFGAARIAECVRVAGPARVPALTIDGTRLPFDVRTGHEPGSRPRCAPDELRLLRLQALTIAGERTYLRRGGCALPCVVRAATVHVPASALARPVSLLPRAARNGNGAPVPGCDDEARAAPQRVGPALRRMFYKTPAELRRRANAGRSGGAGARWSNYGDPGPQYGGGAHYAYLLWNLPRTARGLLPGGGIVEAVLPAGLAIALCPAEHLRLASFDGHGLRNGFVDFVYARAARDLYGWVLAGYLRNGRSYTSTTTGSTIGRRLSRL
jgi:enoyl-CoA hydratase